MEQIYENFELELLYEDAVCNNLEICNWIGESVAEYLEVREYQDYLNQDSEEEYTYEYNYDDNYHCKCKCPKPGK